MEKNYFLEDLFDFILKHKNKVWKLFNIKNKDTRTMSVVSL